jgi:hypothetical protein
LAHSRATPEPRRPVSFRSYRIELGTMPSSKDSPSSYSSFDHQSSFALPDPCLRRVCRQLPRAVRPPAGSPAGVRRRAIVQVGVLEVAGRHSEVVDGLEASPLCQRLARWKVSSFREAIWTRCLTGERPEDTVFDSSMEAEVHRQLHGDWQFVGTAPAIAF